MTPEHIKWLTYWKKCLSESAAANIQADTEKGIDGPENILSLTKISDEHVIKRIFKAQLDVLRKSSNNNDPIIEDIATAQLFIAPFKLKRPSENLHKPHDTVPQLPFLYAAEINKEGELLVPKETFPLFQRRYLEPYADEKTECIIASVEAVDKATTLGKEENKSFGEYLEYIREIFKAVTGQALDQFTVGGFETIATSLIFIREENINAIGGILNLYTNILHDKGEYKALESLITSNHPGGVPPASGKDHMDANALHLGQMGYAFPLSVSQRKSLYAYLGTNDRIFAVNGPPGTGKTTLLQSVVANKVVESAIKGNDPYIILACSTNNQAVTNIIESFSKSETAPGPLNGRWLPDVEGYAVFLPASGKHERELQNINYKKRDGQGLFRQIENESYLSKAKAYYLEKCRDYYGEALPTISAAIASLQHDIGNIQSGLEKCRVYWKRYSQSLELLQEQYVYNTSIDTFLTEDTIDLNKIQEDVNNLKGLEQRVLQYFNHEPFFRKLFCAIGVKSALASRKAELNIILRDTFLEEDRYTNKTEILRLINDKVKLGQHIQRHTKDWINWKYKNDVKGDPPTDRGTGANNLFDELDIKQRHRAFQLALHYWEGRYLLQLEKDLVEKDFTWTFKTPRMKQWKRQSMLMPCFVSTFFMAPHFFNYSKSYNDDKNLLDTPPLFDFIDLLIVDEAGQVSPEIGVPAFSLAKQAMVVGDIKQIEPVWNCGTKVDIGNLRKCELITDYDDEIVTGVYAKKGFLCSSGSLMQMAQNACGFQEPGADEKGVLLEEHRRCYNEIISYCNELAYNGLLKPMRGKAPRNLLFPPMGLYHVEGLASQNNTERYNTAEADAIAQWLLDNEARILAYYTGEGTDKKYDSIEDVVGIITPFVAQKRTLIASLKKAGFKTGKMKIGTVHALQGAERPIVLFSTVYSPGEVGTMFFDRDNKPNMLNVAVSRAQDNFIVFGNKAILNKKLPSPSGILARYLAEIL